MAVIIQGDHPEQTNELRPDFEVVNFARIWVSRFDEILEIKVFKLDGRHHKIDVKLNGYADYDKVIQCRESLIDSLERRFHKVTITQRGWSTTYTSPSANRVLFTIISVTFQYEEREMEYDYSY